MTVKVVSWTVRLAGSAERDFSNIIRWTAEQFGRSQARVYAQTLSSALQELTAGPALSGVTARDDIASGLLTLHVARKQRKGRHFIMFRTSERHKRTIDVMRILHEAMDLSQHVSPDADAK
ncbi:type II toxin-antitoxin system RelE/ParE family toxin [Paraburkholderia megapolitana]|uniref:type II toxin-antitoxin system RelE/ParE family toxin n=1 Tax=Paraburkholderia megapolitana TaxID=420953 RepID=UPI0038B7DA59